MNRLLIIGLLIVTGILNAQTDFKSGYVISSPGDTIYGEIDYRGDILMGSVCKFKRQGSEVTTYYPDDISAFRFTDSKYYVSREIDDKKVFLEYLIKGKINIFYIRDNTGDHYYLDKEDLELIELPYEEGIEVRDDKQVFYESKKHIGILTYYMQDAPEIKSRIQSLKKPEHQNLIKIAEQYHMAVCDSEECIIFEKELPLIKIMQELIGGVIKYSDDENLNDKYHSQVGIIGHVWMPRTNEKIYFRTGVLFTQIEFEGENTNYFKIPVQLEYIYPKGFIRPRIAYGLNFYNQRDRTVSLDIGANIKLTETFFLSATSDIEFNPSNLILPSSLLSNSFKLGLFLSLN